MNGEIIIIMFHYSHATSFDHSESGSVISRGGPRAEVSPREQLQFLGLKEPQHVEKSFLVL